MKHKIVIREIKELVIMSLVIMAAVGIRYAIWLV